MTSKGLKRTYTFLARWAILASDGFVFLSDNFVVVSAVHLHTPERKD